MLRTDVNKQQSSTSSTTNHKKPKYQDKIVKILNLDPLHLASMEQRNVLQHVQKSGEKGPACQQIVNDVVERVQVTILSARTQSQNPKFTAFQNQNLFSQKVTNTAQQLNNEIGIQNSNKRGHHSQQQSLSETRSLKSFRSLQDERLQRKLHRKHENSMHADGSSNSNTRQLSNVRDMIQSQEEVKLFESKFSGCLQKLDAFEKQWQDFKTNLQSVGSSQELDLHYNRQDPRIHQSFDAGLSLTNRQRNYPPLITPKNEDSNYLSSQSLKKQEQNKMPSMNKPIDLRNQLDQIIESPRESILQSPTAINNSKIQAIIQQPQPQAKSAYTSLNKTPTQQQQNQQCKTLQIDLNEEHYNNQRKLTSKENQKVEIQGIQSTFMKGMKTPQMISSSKRTITGGIQGSVGMNLKQMEEARQRSNSGQRQIESGSLTTSQKKDDLVERVMESIKVLNRKEEEIKKSIEIKPQQVLKKNAHQMPNINESLVNPYQLRKRTNTLTVGERPQLNLGSKTVSMNNGSAFKKTPMPSVTTSISNQGSGFIGNSFVKAGFERIRPMTGESQEPQKSSNDIEKPKTSQQQQVKPLQAMKVSTTVETQNKPQTSQASKDKLDQLRKAFTSGKDSQVSRSTKNLVTVANTSAKPSQHNLKTAKVTQQQSCMQINSALNKIDSKPMSKKTDISLVQDDVPPNKNISTINSNNTSIVNHIIITSTSPNKSQIQSLKKSSQQTTPQQKLNQTSPSQSITPVSNNSSAVIVKKAQNGNSKGKFRRQPTQTQVENNNVQAKEQIQQKVQDEQAQKKPKTMLDGYCMGSPDLLKKENVKQGSASLSLSKAKNKSDAQAELQETLSDNEFIPEQPKKLNFQPIQEPSINWNESPQKPIPNKQMLGQQQYKMQLVSAQSESEEDETPVDNHIENKLNNLLQETRRKLQHYENDEDSSSMSDIDMSTVGEGFGNQQIQNMQRIRNKAMTPQILPVNPYQQQSMFGQNPQPQIQVPMQLQQPFVYEQQQQPQLQQQHSYQSYMYQGAPYPNYIYQSNQPQQPPMITIISPAQMQAYPQSQYQVNQMPPPPQMYAQQNIQQFGLPMPSPSQTIDPSYYMRQPQQLPPQMTYLSNQNKQSMIIGVDSKFYYPKSHENSTFIEENHHQQQQQQPYQREQQYIMVGIPPPMQQKPYQGRASLDSMSPSIDYQMLNKPKPSPSSQGSNMHYHE